MHDILVVDDYDYVSDIIKIKLKAEGCEVNLGFKSDEYLESVNKFSPALNIQDVYLKGESRCALFMKPESPQKLIPVIFYSAHTFPVDFTNHCKLDFFLQKLFDLKELSISIKPFSD